MPPAEERTRARRFTLTFGLGAGAILGATTLLVAFAQPELVRLSLGITVVVTALTIAVTYTAAAAVTARRWRRRASIARFAEANGMLVRLVASEEEVPPPLRRRGARHVDVAVRAHTFPQVLVGTRTRTTRRSGRDHEGTTTTVVVPHDMVWAALKFEDDVTKRQAAGMRRRLQLPDDVQLMRESTWFVLALERRRNTLARLPELLAHLDRAADELGPPAPRDA